MRLCAGPGGKPNTRAQRRGSLPAERSTLAGLALRPEPRQKPEGRQHASTREAMSPGEQDSTCRASTS